MKRRPITTKPSPDPLALPVDAYFASHHSLDRIASSDWGALFCSNCHRAIMDGEESPSNPHLHRACDWYR